MKSDNYLGQKEAYQKLTSFFFSNIKRRNFLKPYNQTIFAKLVILTIKK